jgi:hypothetical protein
MATGWYPDLEELRGVTRCVTGHLGKLEVRGHAYSLPVPVLRVDGGIVRSLLLTDGTSVDISMAVALKGYGRAVPERAGLRARTQASESDPHEPANSRFGP